MQVRVIDILSWCCLRFRPRNFSPAVPRLCLAPPLAGFNLFGFSRQIVAIPCIRLRGGGLVFGKTHPSSGIRETRTKRDYHSKAELRDSRDFGSPLSLPSAATWRAQRACKQWCAASDVSSRCVCDELPWVRTCTAPF
jgi:hypothetical protein